MNRYTVVVNSEVSATTRAALEVLDEQRTTRVSSFASRAELIAEAEGGFNVAVVGGVTYRRQDGLALPALSNWRPLDNVLDLRHCGSTSDIAGNFAGIFEQAAEDAALNGWDFRVSRTPDGSPHEFQFIDHTLAGDLRIAFDRSALLMPKTNFQHFASDGTTGPFTITAWPYNAATEGNLSCMVVNGSTETKLSEGVDFTVAGNVVTMTDAFAPGRTIVFSSRKDALGFRSTAGNGRKLILTGDINIDMSRIGYCAASASGSGLTTTNVDHITAERIWIKSPAGYGAASLSKRGDSGFVPLNFKSCHVDMIHCEGMNDLAVYATGGSSAGATDDGGGLYIGNIFAKRCATGLKYVRGGEQATIGALHLLECGTGYLSGETDGLLTGQGVHIQSINAVKLGRRAVDIRASRQGGVHIGAVSVRDIGFMPDGVTATSGPAGVYLEGVAGVQVDYLDVRQRDWGASADAAAIKVAGNDNYGNRVLGGWVQGLPRGIQETGATTNDVGNSYCLTMKDIATPIDTAGALQTHYDLILLTTSGLTITQSRINSQFFASQNGTSALVLTGAVGSPTYTYSMQNLVYRRLGDYTEFSCNVQAVIAHAETAKSLRVSLPAADFTISETFALPVTVGRIQGITVPDNRGIFGEMAPSSNTARFYYYPTDGSAAVLITSDHVTTGATVRIEISGVIPVV